MDRRVGAYVTSTRPAVQSNGAPQSLLIIETRESFWLPLVIQNAISEFPEWFLYVCAPLNVLEWLAPQFPAIRGIRLDLPPGSRASPETFSAIMFSEPIWNVFETEFVLVFQCDTVFAPRAASKMPYECDYYGAACGTITETEFVINGGLSLRRVSAFKKAISYLTDADRALPEDVAFCNVMRRVQGEFRLPSIRECTKFAIESFGDPSRVIGMHGTDKGYCPPALIAAMLPIQQNQKKRMIVDCFTYDGEPILETRLKLLDSVVDRFIVVEALFTHSGKPKEPTFDPAKFAKYKDKIVYMVAEFGPMPEGYGADAPWIKDNGEAWWRESSQRDWMMRGLHGVPDDALMIVSDVDEIPDPSRIIEMDAIPTDHALHLDMAFLVHSPEWQKKEAWSRAFVATKGFMNDKSPTDVRCSTPTHVLPRAGWHCSSFFSVERHVQKINSFAHREFASEIDAVIIAQRLDNGKDPYGRGPEFDCFKTMEHAWLHFV